MIHKNKTKEFHNYLISKYNYIHIKNYPSIQSMTYRLVLSYKQKNKYFLFINMILMLIFYNPNTKTRFLFKTSQINILEIHFKSDNSIYNFIHNFVYIYLPQIDSFSAEFKFFSRKNSLQFTFFKFPLVFELNSLFNSIEYLYNFISNYRFQLVFNLKKQKNSLLNYTFLQYHKLPIHIK